MPLWYDEVFHDRARFGLKVVRTLYSAQSPYQTIEIFDTEQFGRALALDGIYMTSEGDEFFYHEMLVHPALTIAPSIRRVLVIGGGDGGTVREVLRHREVEKVVMVEIDGQVVEACKAHLSSIGSAWDDPRLEVRCEDGIRFVTETDEEPFDVVLLDGTDPVGPGAGLFELDFYRGCKRVLAEGGVFAKQSESPILFADTFRQVQHNLAQLFRHVHPCFGPVPIYASGTWSWTVASDRAEPSRYDETRMANVEPYTRYYNRDVHVGSFAVPNFIRNALKP